MQVLLIRITQTCFPQFALLFNVFRKKIKQEILTRNHDQATQVSENTSTDTSVTRPYSIGGEEEGNDDDTISIPDASIFRRQIQDLCLEGEDKGSTEGANGPILESISQEFTVKKRRWMSH